MKFGVEGVKITQTLTKYDDQANQYDRFRRPSPIILRALMENFREGIKPIVSLGCGTGRMEEALGIGINVIGLDLSSAMLEQASGRLKDLIQANMIQLPFKDCSSSGVYFMQSLHHVGANLAINPDIRENARRMALKEAHRIIHSGPIIILQRDPIQNQAVWFWKYFPEALETKMKIQPKISDIKIWLKELGFSDVSATPIDDPLIKNFYNPESPLDPAFRNSISEFSYLSEEQLSRGLERLSISIHDGSIKDEIKQCKRRFKDIGGSVFIIRGNKRGE